MRKNSETGAEIRKLRKAIGFTFAFIAVLWIIKLIENSLSTDFGYFGIRPRTLEGTIGIITAPLVHGDLTHLLSNTFPFILLCFGIFYFYDQIALEVFVWIYLATGFWVWVAGRDAYHIGASGLIYGLVGFLFFSGVFRKNSRSVAVSLAVLFLYGGMVAGIFPGDPKISYESHLLGSVAGVFCAFFFRNKLMPEERQAPIPASDKDNFPPNLPEQIESTDTTDPPVFHFSFKNGKLIPKDQFEEKNFSKTSDTTYYYTYIPRKK